MSPTDLTVTCIRCADHSERPDVLRARDRLAARDLGDDLDPERYAAIQAAIWRHPLSRAAIRVWLLERAGELVATFDTLDVTVRSRGADGSLCARPGACIASGFVAPEHRLAGHGRRLAGVLSRRLADEGHALVYGVVETTMKVYSEIDADTYPLVDVVWPADHGPSNPCEPLHDLAGWIPPPLRGALDVLLTSDMLAWRLERVALERPQDRARPIGARLGDAWIVWASAPERDALEVLHLRADHDSGPLLVAAARREAAARGLASALAWDGPAVAPWLPPGERRPLDAVLGVRTFAPGLSGAGWLDPQLGHYF